MILPLELQHIVLCFYRLLLTSSKPVIQIDGGKLMNVDIMNSIE